jgi:hypothetical protein
LIDQLVEPEVPSVFLPEALLELLARELADPLVVPAAVAVALELVEIGRRACREDVVEGWPVGLTERLEAPAGAGYGGDGDLSLLRQRAMRGAA